MTDTNSPQPDASPLKSKAAISLSGLMTAAGSIVCFFTLVGFLGGWFWMFELTSHFRVQYFFILLALSLVAVIGRHWRVCVMFFVFAMINGWLLFSFVGFSQTSAATRSESVRLLAWNVNSQNTNFAELDRLIDEHDPDIVMLMEVSLQWGNYLKGLTAFPNQHLVPRDDNFGIAILSKTDRLKSSTLYLGKAELPSIRSDVLLAESTVTLLSTHSLPPAGSYRSHLRDEQLDRVSEWVLSISNSVAVVGDLNITPWSPIYTDFIEKTALINSADGRGLHATWPAFFPPMSIPIDHFLHSTNVVVTKRQILEAAGSDHLPQLVVFTIRQVVSQHLE